MKEEEKMVKAFVLAKVGVTKYMGALHTAMEEIRKIPEVLNAYIIFGRYDLIIEIKTRDLGELSSLVDNKIRAVPGVLSSETFICFEKV